MKFRLIEELQIPIYLYHATYKQFLKSILGKGLGNTNKKIWTDSKHGVVYLSVEPEVAYSYAETAEGLDGVDNENEYLDNIVVLKIDTSTLDSAKFSIDSNVIDNDGSTIEYHGIIYKESIVDIVDEQNRSLGII